MPTVNPQTPTTDEPVPRDLASTTPTSAAPTARELAATTPTSTAPTARSAGDYTPTEGAPMMVGGSADAPQLTMPASFVPAFKGITGGGAALSSKNATAADESKILQGTDDNGALVAYQVREGTDEQALPGIVRPGNFHAETNAFVFVRC